MFPDVTYRGHFRGKTLGMFWMQKQTEYLFFLFFEINFKDSYNTTYFGGNKSALCCLYICSVKCLQMRLRFQYNSVQQ